MKQSRVLSAAVLAVAVMAASVILGACSGGGGSAAIAPPTQKIQLSGVISSGSYTFGKGTFGKSLAMVSLPQIDSVVAIPMDRGELDARNMSSSVPGTIGADGKFDLALPMDKDWLLVLINSQALLPADRFVGSLALNAGSGSTLLNLPATVSTLSSMNLGTVTRVGGDAVSGATVTASDFGMNDSQFTAFANSDDVFKNAKNIINNYGADGVWYQLRPDFEWSGNYYAINGLYSGPSWTYLNYHFQMDTNSTSLTILDLCTNGTASFGSGSFTDVAWTPPTTVTTVGGFHTYSPGSPILNTAATCTNYTSDTGPAIKATNAPGGGFFATNAYYDGTQTLSYSVSEWFAGDIPSGVGNWTWSEGGVVKATFDPSVSTPLDGSGNALGYVPSIQLTVNGSKVITAVDVKWYFFDGVGYTPVADADLAAMKHIIGRYEIIFDAASRHASFDLDPTVATQLHIDLPATGPDIWTYADNDNTTDFLATDAEAVGVFYSSGGIGRYFFARATMTL